MTRPTILVSFPRRLIHRQTDLAFPRTVDYAAAIQRFPRRTVWRRLAFLLFGAAAW